MDENRNEYYEYFEQKPSKWDIIEFLEQCDLEPYGKKVDRYIRCLRCIARGEQKKRKEKAEELLRRYSEGNKPDQQRVKDWEKTRKSSKISGGSSIHIQNSTLSGNSFAVAGNTSTIKATTEATTKRKREGLRERKDDEEQERTKRVHFEEKSGKKLSSGKRGDTLPDGTKIEKLAPMDLLPSDTSDNDSSQDDDDSSSQVDDYDHDYDSDDDEDVPVPEETLDSVLSNKKTWILPSGKDFYDVVAKRISANAKATKKKKRLSAIEKAILRYGASQIIDLSAHMKQWFSIEDREFVMKDYKALLQVSEMPDGERSFIKIVEDMVHKGNVDEAFKFCTEKLLNSEKNSYIYKISKIYADFIYKSQDQADILDYNAKNTHTEIDVILKACAYIIEGLNKNLQIFPRWGESFCPLSKSVDHIRGRKCDVRFLSTSGVDVGEWEFSAKATAPKAIGDRCRSARINQSILNGLLEYELNDEQVKDIQVPFLQFAGTSGQMLVEDLIGGFYIVFPGPKFELPTKLRDIGKLKTSINVIKSVMDIYKKTCRIIENLETTHHEFDDIFDDFNTVKPTIHFKSKQIHKPWWTPKSKRS